MRFRAKMYLSLTLVMVMICVFNIWMLDTLVNFLSNSVEEPIDTFNYGIRIGFTRYNATPEMLVTNSVHLENVRKTIENEKKGLYRRGRKPASVVEELSGINSVNRTNFWESFPDTLNNLSKITDITNGTFKEGLKDSHIGSLYFTAKNQTVDFRKFYENYTTIINKNETGQIHFNDTGNISTKTSEAFEPEDDYYQETDKDGFDISDTDDHVYLVENPEFRRMLEIESGNNFIAERMWKERQKSHSSYSDRKQVYNMYYRAIVNQAGINCDKVIENYPDEVAKAKEIMSELPRKEIKTEKYAHIEDCDNFKRRRGYIEHPLSDSERNFPLAFSIIMYRDVEQTERLLRAIYRPHNYYCIHVDSKSDKHIRKAIERIVRCFPNVFISSQVENVTWGDFTVLKADLNCMQELWKYKLWKYFINLTGQEFPLKTNREIVKILEAMERANIVDGTWVRAKEKYFYRWTSAGHRPPHGIRPIKGSVHVLVNRHFVDFCLHDNRALEFLGWLRQTQIPDETYFASLNHNPHLGIKGSFLGDSEEYPLKPAFMRYKNWEFGHATHSRHCGGKYVRHICILGVEDLHRAYHDVALFVNKFHLDFEYLALDCLEEVLHKKTWQQYLDDTDIDVSYYRHLDYVKYKVT